MPDPLGHDLLISWRYFASLSVLKLMLLKRNILFSTRITYMILIYMTETLIRRTEMVKYLGIYFTNDSKNSPGFEHLLENAGRAGSAVQGKIKKMGNIVPELMVRLGNIMIIPIVLFACQIWGVNLMDIRKGLIRLVQGYSISILTFFDIF